LPGGCGLDSTGSGQGPVAGCCECGDERSGSCSTELVLTNHENDWYKCTDVCTDGAKSVTRKSMGV
jgi:hypothetical protein